MKTNEIEKAAAFEKAFDAVGAAFDRAQYAARAAAVAKAVYEKTVNEAQVAYAAYDDCRR